MPKKNAKIIIILVAFALILFGFIYYYFFLRSTAPETAPGIDETTGLFPSDGRGAPDDSTGKIGEPDGTGGLPVPRYRKISQKPVSGAVITIIKDDTKGNAIRYMDRATGHIYEAWTKSMGQERISNTTIPKVYETLWNKSGDSFIARYLDEETEDIISFYAGLVKKEGSENMKSDIYSFDGSFLQKNISDMSVSDGGKSLFYVLKKKDGSSLIKSAFGTTENVEILNSPLREWLVEWFGNGYLLKTKPTYKTGGFVYQLNNGGNVTKLLGDVNGLTALGRADGTAFLYSESTDNLFSLFSFETGNRKITKINMKTLPDKCVWSKKSKTLVYCAIPSSVSFGKYPDDWYQGSVSFDDVLWVIDVNMNLGSIVADPNMYFEPPVDGINLILSEDEDYLIFTNKKDYSLWGINLIPEPLGEEGY
ncbi:hypothetical protein KJ991_02075 [Patescibacteria group bacterium]|nr:hypothetical protein [Patescibacteria group bacterium]MBU4057481.1 hypothetical protein [Patescibacteria group bacterium]MBU4115587.1 hypothetical protein [Patescibacteria group bacterium]